MVDGWGAGAEGWEGMASPALGGGGTGECVAGAVVCGTAPGCGGGGEYVVVAVGSVVVGVARLPGAVPVGTGRLGAAPGCAGGAPGCAVA